MSGHPTREAINAMSAEQFADYIAGLKPMQPLTELQQARFAKAGRRKFIGGRAPAAPLIDYPHGPSPVRYANNGCNKTGRNEYMTDEQYEWVSRTETGARNAS
jgi:hypothetical protein